MMGVLFWKNRKNVFVWRDRTSFVWNDDAIDGFMFVEFSKLHPSVEFSQLFPSIEFGVTTLE
jgi:hypothetical protein